MSDFDSDEAEMARLRKKRGHVEVEKNPNKSSKLNIEQIYEEQQEANLSMFLGTDSKFFSGPKI